MKKEERTTIQVSRELKDFLVAQAIKKESYDETIKRLLEKAWKVQFNPGGRQEP